MGLIIGGLFGAGVTGAATTYFFHRSELNNVGLKLLGKDSLHGIAGTVTALALTLLAMKTVKSKSGNEDQKLYFSYAVSSVLIAVIAKIAL